MFHERRIPTDAVVVLIQNVKNKDLIGVETVDAAFEVGGCANAFRNADEPTTLLATAPARSESEIVALASQAEADMQQRPMAAGDENGGQEAIPPIVFQLALAVLQFFMNRK